MRLNEKIGHTFVDIDFTNKVCILHGNSATGKSYLFKLLNSYYMDDAMLIDSGDLGKTGVSKIVDSNYKLLMLDNADLYLTEQLLRQYLNYADTVLIAMHNPYELKLNDIGYYSCFYKEKKYQ